jgi:hypothetical protein
MYSIVDRLINFVLNIELRNILLFFDHFCWDISGKD